MVEDVKCAIEWLENKKREELDFMDSLPPDSMAAYATKCIIKYYDLAINALKKEVDDGKED